MLGARRYALPWQPGNVRSWPTAPQRYPRSLPGKASEPRHREAGDTGAWQPPHTQGHAGHSGPAWPCVAPFVWAPPITVGRCQAQPARRAEREGVGMCPTPPGDVGLMGLPHRPACAARRCGTSQNEAPHRSDEGLRPTPFSSLGSYMSRPKRPCIAMPLGLGISPCAQT